MNYFQRLLMHSTSGSTGIRPISHQPYSHLSHPNLLDTSPPENDDLTSRPGGIHQLEQEANETHLDPWGRKRSAIDSMDKDVASSAFHSHGSAMLMQQPLIQAIQAMGGQKAQRAVDERRIDSFADPAHANRSGTGTEGDESLRRHQSSQLDGQARPQTRQSREESQRSLQSGLIDDFSLMPLRSQPRPADSPSSLTPSLFLQKPMPRTLEVSESGERRRSQSNTQTPEIHVTIGRVEVRAAVSPAPASKPAAKSSAMSLDEYLKQRREGRR